MKATLYKSLLRLPEVGGPILRSARCIDDKRSEIAAIMEKAKEQIAALEKEVKEDEQRLLSRIHDLWTLEEIAEAMRG